MEVDHVKGIFPADAGGKSEDVTRDPPEWLEEPKNSACKGKEKTLTKTVCINSP